MKKLPLVCLVLSLALATAPQAFAQTVIVPNNLVNVDGNSNNTFPFGFTGGMRWQQVFNLSQFSGPIFIGQIALRNDASAGFAFSRNLSSVQISLSTTANGPNALSTTFAANLGADNTIVHNGPLTLSSANLPGPGNTRAFDTIITLQAPFAYNPAGGHLLLDVLNSSPENHSFQVLFDAESNAGNGFVSRLVGLEGNPGAATGSADPNGFVTQFTAAIPEPASIALFGLVGLGSAGAAYWRRLGRAVTAR